MSYLVWCPELETEEDGLWVATDRPEDAASGYALHGKRFEALAEDGGSLVFCAVHERSERVHRVQITAHYTRTVLPDAG